MLKQLRIRLAVLAALAALSGPAVADGDAFLGAWSCNYGGYDVRATLPMNQRMPPVNHVFEMIVRPDGAAGGQGYESLGAAGVIPFEFRGAWKVDDGGLFFQGVRTHPIAGQLEYIIFAKPAGPGRLAFTAGGTRENPLRVQVLCERSR